MPLWVRREVRGEGCGERWGARQLGTPFGLGLSGDSSPVWRVRAGSPEARRIFVAKVGKNSASLCVALPTEGDPSVSGSPFTSKPHCCHLKPLPLWLHHGQQHPLTTPESCVSGDCVGERVQSYEAEPRPG